MNQIHEKSIFLFFSSIASSSCFLKSTLVVFSILEDNFLGFAADGFPIYGPKNPDSLNVSGLDDCNGEYGPTPDFPDSIYHYHTISVAPYIIGAYCGDLSNWRQ